MSKTKFRARSKRAYMEGTPDQKIEVHALLCNILACLRAQSLSYQTSHWQVKGDDYYGNHLLFMRLYESVGAEIDALAEKMVGYLGSEAVALPRQVAHISQYTARWCQVPGHLERGLQSERDLQSALKVAYNNIKRIGAMTLGLDDWIMATANAHESNQYLLQQALNRAPVQKFASDEAPDRFREWWEFLDPTSRKRVLESLRIRKDSGWNALEWERLIDYYVRNHEGGQGYTRSRHFASGAPSAEKHFYDNPEKREVREFADTGAITNIPPVAAEASEEDQLDLSKKQEVAKAKEAPPTPEEIADAPGGKAMSTLNRFVVDTEEPSAEKAVKMTAPLLESKKLMAAWLRSLG